MPKVIPSDGVGLCPDLHDIYESMEEGDDYKKLIDEMATKLIENCQAGNKIKRRLIPQYYIKKIWGK